MLHFLQVETVWINIRVIFDSFPNFQQKYNQIVLTNRSAREE